MEANSPDDLEGPRQSSQMGELQQGFIWWIEVRMESRDVQQLT
jgi:hypothetical protein